MRDSKRKIKVIRTSTIPHSLNTLLKGQLKFLNQYFEIIAVSGAHPKLFELIEREGVRVNDISMNRKISLINDIKSLFRLYVYFKKEKPIIVHSITPKAGLLSMLAAKFAGVPVRMHTFTGLIFPTAEGNKKKILIVMDRLLCWAATNIYPEGNGVKKDLISYKITNKTLHVIANGNVNGIDIDYYSLNNFSKENIEQLKNDLGFKKEDFIYIFVGRLVKDKGINELIESFKRLNDNNIKLLLVGGFDNNIDPLNPETIQEIKNNNNILYQGYQKDIRPFLAISNALVFPSYREGFPNVVMQAGAMELPAIVTDINGSNEIIQTGNNGIIIPSKNINRLRDAMKELKNNKELYQLLKSNSRPMIKNRYQQNVVWEALLEEYNKNIKNSI